ncbi:MAG: hypothetical protein ACFB5Z_15320 [Elainellaceae cyanobacterium]
MPSTPYKSRLLTFLTARSLKLRDQAQHRFRQAKLVALWSAQITLYPVYAVFQSTRVVGRQVGQVARRVFPRLQSAAQAVKQSVDPVPGAPQAPPAADAPIRQTLRSLDLFALPLPVSAADSALTRRPSTDLALNPETGVLEACGIACLVDSRRLVLTDQYNAIHDVLTPSQAAHLQRRLVLELAKFWHFHKQRQLVQRPLTPLPLPRDRHTMLPPVRAVRRLMGWMQTSPVAMSVNLFQEARLSDSLLQLADAAISDAVISSDAVGGTALSGISGIRSGDAFPTQALRRTPVHALPMIDAASPPPAPLKPQRWWTRLVPRWLQKHDDDAASPPWFDPDHQGKDGWQTANQAVEARRNQLPPARPSLPIPIAQRWSGLSFWGRPGDTAADDLTDGLITDDTAGEPFTAGDGVNPADQGAIALSHDASNPPDYRAAPDLLDEIEQYLRSLIGPRDKSLRSSASLAQADPASTIQSQSSQIPNDRLWGDQLQAGDLASEHSLGFGDRRRAAQGARAVSEGAEDGATTLSTKAAQDIQTTWIEAQATPIGYNRHPLEQILSWVDQSLLWIEAWLVKALQWLNSSR